ncbi:hypothetical protein V6C53_06200 [Desulfocurvibacter africanus]|uniref:Uncharacterized protein n=2 Tax=Desulfocurvibacter africanus TaxID=873 RepID=F3Z057_DESAF|nr:hypothetical protein [Desulfocurvibacter africanus]EGJ49759.1 hypothetical protein Desaf_1421 [Desulfocurvibacter africanus subsp. africanus str. Walvis Bay]EMG35908.1 hypothetical protein PCS_03392 [Desulfocurvibacter africanus PCS]
MLLKESEAKFKYCPLLKTHDDKLKFCQAAMCMMWRPAGEGQEGLGYCGLAGAPVQVMAVLRERRSKEE